MDLKQIFIIVVLLNIYSTGLCKSDPAILNTQEVDNKFLLTENQVIFSQFKDGHYNLYKYSLISKKVEVKFSKGTDLFSPFSINSSISALSDINGNQRYKCINTNNKYFQNKNFSWVISSPNGKVVIYRLENSPNIFLYNIKNNKNIVICKVKLKIRGCAFSENCSKVVISFDDSLLLYDIKSQTRKLLLKNLKEEKTNPFIFENKIYFASNALTNYYEVYETNIEGKIFTRLISEKSNDLKSPKRVGNFIYYIEVDHSQYLLKRLNLNTGEKKTLTSKGVLFNFEVTSNHTIMAIYSDINTPKSLIEIRIKNGKVFIKNITNHSRQTNCEFILINDKGLSPAYMLVNKQEKIRGVILFFHPGINQDFSPRWETILISLSRQGYIIIAPNFPKSSGYGKSYFNMDYKSSIKDMLKWTNYIRIKYKGVPIDYLSYSSANELMEDVLFISPDILKLNNHPFVSAAVSYFGVSTSHRKCYRTPTLYFLGKCDPYISYQERTDNILNQVNFGFLSNKIHLFQDEGHWLRKEVNVKKSLSEIVNFLQNANYIDAEVLNLKIQYH